LLADGRADILLTHTFKPNILGRIAARRAGIPIVAVSRGWTWENLKVRAYEALDRVNLRFVDHVVAVSDGQGTRVRHAGVPSTRMSVIRNAARLFPASIADFRVEAVRARQAALVRDNRRKQLSADLELRLRAVYYDRIDISRVEPLVNGITAAMPSLDDMQFLLAHIRELLPERPEEVAGPAVWAALQVRACHRRDAKTRYSSRAVHFGVSTPLAGAAAAACGRPRRRCRDAAEGDERDVPGPGHPHAACGGAVYCRLPRERRSRAGAGCRRAGAPAGGLCQPAGEIGVEGLRGGAGGERAGVMWWGRRVCDGACKLGDGS